jgi:hypothetical protein
MMETTPMPVNQPALKTWQKNKPGYSNTVIHADIVNLFQLLAKTAHGRNATHVMHLACL